MTISTLTFTKTRSAPSGIRLLSNHLLDLEALAPSWLAVVVQASLRSPPISRADRVNDQSVMPLVPQDESGLMLFIMVCIVLRCSTAWSTTPIASWHPEGYRRSAFCAHYETWKKTRGLTMRAEGRNVRRRLGDPADDAKRSHKKEGHQNPDPPNRGAVTQTQTPVASLRKPPSTAVTMPWIKRSR